MVAVGGGRDGGWGRGDSPGALRGKGGVSCMHLRMSSSMAFDVVDKWMN